MYTRLRRATCGTLLLGAVCVAASPATAQMAVTAVGVAEWDTNETLLLLAGLSASPGGMRLQPVFGVMAYNVGFESGTGRTNVFSTRPYVGLRNNFEGGSIEGTIGYAFTNRDEPVTPTGGPVVAIDRGDGVVATGQWDYWGTGGPLGAQAIAAYNFGSEALWTRGRLTTRFTETGTVRLGGEVAYYTDDDFNVWQPGVVLEWRPRSPTPGPIVGFGVGRKLANEGDDATYFKLEVVLPFAR